MKKILAITALSFAALSVHAKDIVDTAVGAGNFKTLAAALTAAGPGRHAQGQGPVHRVRADGRGLRQDPQGRPRQAARRQGQADRRVDLPRGSPAP